MRRATRDSTRSTGAHGASGPALVAALAVSLAACSTEPVRRMVTLAPSPALPEGAVAIDAESVTLDFAQVELLSPAHRYLAWVKTPVAYALLGAPQHGTRMTIALADLGVVASDIEEITVTVEDAAGAPTAPSTTPVLHADGSGPLGIPGVTHEVVDGSSAMGMLEDEDVEVTSAGLPRLPSSLFYGVWAVAGTGGGATEDPHAGHTQHAGETAPSLPTNVVLLGALDDTGSLSLRADFLVTRIEGLVITVEAAEGAETISPTRLLEGDVELPEGSGEDDPGSQHVH